MVKVMIHLLITGAKNRLQYIYMSERESERKKQGLKMIKEPHAEKHSRPSAPHP